MTRFLILERNDTMKFRRTNLIAPVALWLLFPVFVFGKTWLAPQDAPVSNPAQDPTAPTNQTTLPPK
jgi:hypothetical protein